MPRSWILQPFALTLGWLGLRHCETSCLEQPMNLAAYARVLNTYAFAGRVIKMALPLRLRSFRVYEIRVLWSLLWIRPFASIFIWSDRCWALGIGIRSLAFHWL